MIKSKETINPIYPFNVVKKGYKVKKNTDPFDFIKTLQMIEKIGKLKEVFGEDGSTLDKIISNYDYEYALDIYLEYITNLDSDIYVIFNK